MFLNDFINQMKENYQNLTGETIPEGYTISIYRKTYHHPDNGNPLFDPHLTVEIAWGDNVISEAISNEFAEELGIFQRPA